VPSPSMKARIERFARAVRRLKGIGEIPLEQFLADEDKIDASERNLQVAIEALMDIGEALISMMNWEAPKSYREVATLLSGHDVITLEQGRRLEELIRLRNVLVHNYVYVDPRNVYQGTLKVGELTTMMNSLLAYVQARGMDP